eukprot:m.24564 g.24564  ORF g.24564 m.24564 type:complete len:54 (+) comp11527_c2_seq1:446-607(+)
MPNEACPEDITQGNTLMPSLAEKVSTVLEPSAKNLVIIHLTFSASSSFLPGHI